MNPLELLNWKHIVMVNPAEVFTFLTGKKGITK
jgi:hypothetical protein